MASAKIIKLGDEDCWIDRMSRLPDELLVFILSLLRLKEAAATSILSRRWRYLWTFRPKLDFDSSDFLRKARGRAVDLYPESLNYASWVDCVLGLHNEGCAVEEFRLDFCLRKVHKEFIDRCLIYALARKVQRLELDFTSVSESGGCSECYIFPYELLRSDLDSIDYRHLRRVCLSYVNVSDEAFEFFLCNCPVLEDLSVAWSGPLSRVKIIGPLPALKRLEIRNCLDMKSIEIRDANIVFFKYLGKKFQHFVLKNVPLLVEMHVGGLITLSMEDLLAMVSSYLPLLGNSHYICPSSFLESPQDAMMFASSSVKMPKLKQLWVTFIGCYSEGYGDSFMPLTTVIRASPFLQRFVLEAIGALGEELDIFD